MNARRDSKPTNWVNQAASPMRLCVLILSLLLAQALGLVHGIEHAPRSHQQTERLEKLQSTVSDLFAGHDEESTCQVFDQLSHGSALLGDTSASGPLTLVSFFLDTYRGATPAHQRSLIQARGPPAVFTAS